MRADKLYLVGFMGAGKTTVARALGRRLGWRVEDIDERIEARERRSVVGHLRPRGRAVLPAGRAAVLQELLPERNIVVATGGGTFVDPDNRAVMLTDGAVAWLDIPLARVIDRVPPTAAGRWPRIASRWSSCTSAAGSPTPGAHAHRREQTGRRNRRTPAGVDRLLM